MRYCIQSNDGRFVTQQLHTPALTKSPALAYVWDDPALAKALLPAYMNALKDTGILALKVVPVEQKPK